MPVFIDNLENFLDDLKNKGIKISVKDGQLVLNAPKGMLTGQLKSEISVNKEQIISYLENREVLQSIHIPLSRQFFNRENVSLSFSQQRLWFLYQLNPESPIYNISAAFYLKGELNIDSLKKAIQEIVNRHQILRTRFDYENGLPYQKIYDKLEINLPVTIVSSPKEAKAKATHDAIIAFNLNELPLLRFNLFKINEREFLFHITMHHIISDAWSCGIMIRELSALYQSYLHNHEPNLLKQELHYADFAIWQRSWLKNDLLSEQLSFWKEYLKDVPEVLSLPTDFPRSPNQTFAGDIISVEIPEKLRDRLKDLGKDFGTTLFILYIAAFQILLYRYSRQEDIVTGFPVAGRHHKGTENILGFFVNTLLLRSNFEDEPKFSEFIKQTHQNILNLFLHQDIPFEKLVEEFHHPRNMAHTPLFQVMFVFQNVTGELPEFPGMEIELTEIETGTAKFDLTITIRNDGLNADIEYNTSLFNRDTIELFLKNYQTLLESIIVNPDEKISRLEIIHSQQKNELLNCWPATDRFESVKTVPELVLENVKKFPGKTALTFNDKNTTYCELNSRANKLANYLIKNGVLPGTSVGICLEISDEMIVVLLAILKAGGVYVPLDPAIPPERFTFIINDSSLLIIITQQNLQKIFPDTTAKILLIENLSDLAESEDLPEIKINPSNPAYIIYTSGSTGKPNGVMVTHANVSRLFYATDKLFSFDENDVWVLFHSVAFDFSVWEIWGCLNWGGRLVIVPWKLTRTPDLFYQKICAEKVTVLNQTPSAFYHFSREALQ